MPARTHKIRIMIADDHAILRAGLRMLINAQADMEVVSEGSPMGETVSSSRYGKRNQMWHCWTSPCPGAGGYESASGDGASCRSYLVIIPSRCTMTLPICERYWPPVPLVTC